MAEKRVLDMTDVKEGSNYTRRNVDEGDYAATITGVVDAVAKDETDMWVFTISLDAVSRATYPYYVKLDAKNLWKISRLFQVTGQKLERKRGAVDPNRLVGKKIGVAMVDDEYNGRINSTVDDVFAVAEVKGTVATEEPVIADYPEEDELILELDD